MTLFSYKHPNFSFCRQSVLRLLHPVIRSLHPLIRSLYSVIRSLHPLIHSLYSIIRSLHPVIHSLYSIIRSLHPVIQSYLNLRSTCYPFTSSQVSSDDLIISSHGLLCMYFSGPAREMAGPPSGLLAWAPYPPVFHILYFL